MDKTTKIVTAVAVAAAVLFPSISIIAGAGEEPVSIEQSAE